MSRTEVVLSFREVSADFVDQSK